MEQQLPVNLFKRALAQGKPQIGLWSQMCSNTVAEVLAGCGYDWLLFDMEHAPNELSDLLNQMQAVNSARHWGAPPVTPIVRPPWNDMVLFKRLLDLGAQTLLVPYVQTAEEAAQAVAYTRYPPAGVRGVAASSRAAGYGRVKDYANRAAAELCLLVQVETQLGLDNLEAIARIEGVDGVFIGPSDLAAALGHLGNPRHPKVLKAIEHAVQRIRACHKAVGILTPDVAFAKQCLQWGCLFVAVGADQNVLRDGAQALRKQFPD